MSGVERIAAERKRQIEVENYRPETDRGRTEQLVRAAEAYGYRAEIQIIGGNTTGLGPPSHWPWHPVFWKPSDDPIRNLEKAGALIAAAIDSLETDGDL